MTTQDPGAKSDKPRPIRWQVPHPSCLGAISLQRTLPVEYCLLRSFFYFIRTDTAPVSSIRATNKTSTLQSSPPEFSIAATLKAKQTRRWALTTPINAYCQDKNVNCFHGLSIAWGRHVAFFIYWVSGPPLHGPGGSRGKAAVCRGVFPVSAGRQWQAKARTRQFVVTEKYMPWLQNLFDRWKPFSCE
jgi:hypothetical protein